MAAILLITIGSVSVLNAWLAATRVRTEVESQLKNVARTLEAGNFPLESNVLKQTSALCGAQLLILSESGGVQASSLPDRWVGPPPSQVTNWRDLELHESISIGGELKGETFFIAGVNLDRRPVGGGLVELYFFYPERTWQDATRQAALGPLFIGAVALVLVSAVALWVAGSVTRPVHRLQDQVKTIAGGNYQSLPLPPRDDEVRDLAGAVNELAARLAKYEEEVRGNERLRTLAHLGSGIAHQVRNAATGCRIAIDLHERDCTANGAPRDERLVVAKRQLSLIETHVQRLLVLGKPAQDVCERIELAALVEDTLELVRPTAAHLNVDLQVAGSLPNAATEGDGEALQQMLVNLLINAIQAASSHRDDAKNAAAKVLLRATLAGNSLTIAIGDNGPGVPDTAAEKLFQPFASNKPGGTGLGLSVARQTARLHGGDIRWQREDGLTWFLVELPNWHGWHSDR
jgi:signal transduction histidine kinase